MFELMVPVVRSFSQYPEDDDSTSRAKGNGWDISSRSNHLSGRGFVWEY